MSKDNLKLNEFWLESVEKVNQSFNERVVKDLSLVSKIDEKILQLVDERNYVLYGLNSRCLAHKNTRVCLGISPYRIWKEYQENGFNSSIVKEAIQKVRALFFDDTKEKFQKFYCTQIIHEEFGSHSDYIDFIFEDDDEHSMKFSFDTKEYEHDGLFEYKKLNGYIYFRIKIGNDYYTINRSFDAYALRQSVEDCIDNVFKSRKIQKFQVFENNTLLEKIEESFKDSSSMRSYDLRQDRFCDYDKSDLEENHE